MSAAMKHYALLLVLIAWYGNKGIRFVGQGTNNRPKDHGGAKASDEELANVAPFKSVVLVQSIYVWSLQPVAS